MSDGQVHYCVVSVNGTNREAIDSEERIEFTLRVSAAEARAACLLTRGGGLILPACREVGDMLKDIMQQELARRMEGCEAIEVAVLAECGQQRTERFTGHDTRVLLLRPDAASRKQPVLAVRSVTIGEDGGEELAQEEWLFYRDEQALVMAAGAKYKAFPADTPVVIDCIVRGAKTEEAPAP